MRALILLLLLASCAKQEPPKIEADVVIHVTGEGTVHWNGERVRLADVAARLRKLETGSILVVDGAADANWGHVAWAVAVVQAADGMLAVPVTHESRDPVHIPPAEYIRILDPGPFLRMELRRTGHGATKFALGKKVTTRPDEARRWIADGGSLIDPYGVFRVEAAGDVPFGDVHAMLRAAPELDHVAMDGVVKRPPLRVMLQDPLPVSPGVFGRRPNWNLTQYDLAPLALPLAAKGQTDKDDDPDDRFILNLDHDGRILYKGESISLERLATALKNAARTYSRIKRLKEPNNPHAGYYKLEDGRLVSRLFVLLRADHDLPWNRIRTVVETLDSSGFFKLQFATRRYAIIDHSPEDADRVGVERIEIANAYENARDDKLQCWLRVEPHPDSAEYIEVEITADEKFRIGGVEVREVAALKEEIKKRRREIDQDDKLFPVGRVRPLPETRFQLVVSAVDAFARAGMEKVDLK